MMVTVKYILIILFADNDGEGGTFSTYSLLSRYVSSASNFTGPYLTAARLISQTEILGKPL